VTSGCKPANEDFLLQVEHLQKKTEATQTVLSKLGRHASHSKNIHVLSFDEKSERTFILYVYQPLHIQASAPD
jgi:hypothetical protein